MAKARAIAAILNINNSFQTIAVKNTFKTTTELCSLPLNLVSKPITGRRTFTNCSSLRFPLGITSYGSVKLARANASGHHQHFRNYSTSNDENDKESPSSKKIPRLPELMEAPFLVWPSVLKTIKNWMFINFVIKPHLDKDFVLVDFVQGTKQALDVVSHRLAANDFKSLDGMVVPEALETLKTNIQRMSVAQRNEIAVNQEEVYFSFPYEVGVFDGEDDENQQFVEITMVYHSLKGLKELHDNNIGIPLNIGLVKHSLF